MNTLADRYYRDTHYPIPHADFLRLQHAHATGVLFLAGRVASYLC